MSERKQGTAQPHRDSDVLGFRANLRNGWSHGTLCSEFQKMYSLSSPILFVSFLKFQGPSTYLHIGIELSRWLWTSYSFNSSFCSRTIFKMLSCITAVIMNISVYPHTQGSTQQTTQHTKCPGQSGGSGKATVSPNDRARMNKMSQWGILVTVGTAEKRGYMNSKQAYGWITTKQAQCGSNPQTGHREI